MEPLLTVRNLSTEYASFGGTVCAVDGMSFDVAAGELLGVVGVAGSGKSTLVYSILNLVPPPGTIVAGEVLFRGENLLRLSEQRLERIRGAQIGLIVSDPRRHLNPLMRIGDQIANTILAHQSINKAVARRQAQDLIAAVGIPDPAWRMRSYPHELSGGMCQRVAIAMAISNNPRLILADEPSAGLDVTVQVQILDLLRAAARQQGSAAILVTRDLGIVAHYCQRIAVVHEGRIAEIRPTREFFLGANSPYGDALLRATKLARVGGAAVRGSPVAATLGSGTNAADDRQMRRDER